MYFPSILRIDGVLLLLPTIMMVFITWLYGVFIPSYNGS
jgi:hypothetical protein